MPEAANLDNSAGTKIKTVHSHPDNYNFKEFIFFDMKFNPECHYVVYEYNWTVWFRGVASIFLFPLRTTFIPCYMTLDLKVISPRYCILKYKVDPKKVNKLQIWGFGVGLKGIKKLLHFQGTNEMNGVGVFIIKQHTDINQKYSIPKTENKEHGMIQGIRKFWPKQSWRKPGIIAFWWILEDEICFTLGRKQALCKISGSWCTQRWLEQRLQEIFK